MTDSTSASGMQKLIARNFSEGGLSAIDISLQQHTVQL